MFLPLCVSAIPQLLPKTNVVNYYGQEHASKPNFQEFALETQCDSFWTAVGLLKARPWFLSEHIHVYTGTKSFAN